MKKGSLILLAALAACGAAATISNDAANSATQSNRRSPPKAKASVPGFAGYWEGQFDGGAGTATIVQAAPGANQYMVDKDVAGNTGCSGQAHGAASVQGGLLVMAAHDPDQPGQCRVTFTRRGSSLAVAESNCSYFHGMSCGFSGSLRFRRATDTLEPPLDAD